jgi:hypothetical protein
MPLDHIALDQCSMAGTQLLRDVVFHFDIDQFPAPDVFPFDFEPVGLQVPDPGTATTSASFLIDRY